MNCSEMVVSFNALTSHTAVLLTALHILCDIITVISAYFYISVRILSYVYADFFVVTFIGHVAHNLKITTKQNFFSNLHLISNIMYTVYRSIHNHSPHKFHIPRHNQFGKY